MDLILIEIGVFQIKIFQGISPVMGTIFLVTSKWKKKKM